MVRKRPTNRFADLVRAAADVFIESGGYKQTQMEDIAKRIGVSKGTLYLYVESKEALFDIALRFADQPEAFQEPGQLPLPTPAAGSTLDYITGRFEADESFRKFVDLMAAPLPTDVRSELKMVVQTLYRALYTNRHALKLVDTCALDHPVLAKSWYAAGRGGVTGLLVPFLSERIEAGLIPAVPDVDLAARFVLESCMLWAVHLHWDPHPEPLNHAQIEDTLVHLLVHALSPGERRQ